MANDLDVMLAKMLEGPLKLIHKLETGILLLEF